VLQVSIWSRLLTLIILLGGILVALPNALPPDVRARMPKFLPSAAVNLGLDLQGGSYLLLGVDFDQVTRDRAESLMGDIRAGLRKAHLPFTDINTRGDTVTVRITDAARIEEARTLLQTLNPAMTGSVLSVVFQSANGQGGGVASFETAGDAITAGRWTPIGGQAAGTERWTLESKP